MISYFACRSEIEKMIKERLKKKNNQFLLHRQKIKMMKRKTATKINELKKKY